MKRFPCNCLIAALIWGRLRMRPIRSQEGALHFFWRDRDGRAFHFTNSGGAHLTRLLYLGSIERLPRRDAARA